MRCESEGYGFINRYLLTCLFLSFLPDTLYFVDVKGLDSTKCRLYNLCSVY